MNHPAPPAGPAVERRSHGARGGATVPRCRRSTTSWSSSPTSTAPARRSANELFAKAILRMGVPVSPRNIFPSNIQGLPTWYEVRVTEEGHLGRRGGVDLMVAMNPQTWTADVAEIEPGGYLFYDNSKPLPPSRFREDVHVIGVPLTELCKPPTASRASASCSRTSSTSARCRCCWTWNTRCWRS
jgi:2-oxoglutarate ferredoxin oxidoreductase subunit alpha